MDPDYILPRDAVREGAGSAVRRSVAVHRWLEAKGDAEYAKALESIESSQQREAWRVFRQINGRSVVQTFRVEKGEAICDTPFGLEINRWALAQGQDTGHTLLSALGTLNIDDIITGIQCGPLF